MTKIFIFMITLGALVGVGSIKASEFTTVDYVETTGVGHTINIATASDVQDFNASTTVLDLYFLLDYVDLIKFNSNRAEVEEDFYSSVSEMYTSVANTMNGGYSAAGIYSGFFASISSAFSSTELYISLTLE